MSLFGFAKSLCKESDYRPPEDGADQAAKSVHLYLPILGDHFLNMFFFAGLPIVRSARLPKGTLW
jgi:hypothetical protein